MNVLAACHLHSAWSYDGNWSLKALCATFRERGYNVLMMTEHDRGFTAAKYRSYREACAEVSSDTLLVLPGIEYSDPTNTVHVLVWGLTHFLGEGLPTGSMLEEIRAANGVAVLAHPSRRNAWRCFEPQWADQLVGMEVWNRKYDGWAPSKRAQALLRFGRMIPFVGMDFHTSRQLFPLAMTVRIGGQISEEMVLQSLRSQCCHPRTFGVSLDHNLFRQTFPILNVAEQGRRTAAFVMRRAGLLGR